MLYGLLLTLFIFVALLLILLVLIQQGKSSMGLGGLGGGAQMLFGGSGGQDLFQKTTWVLAAIFMASSMALALLKAKKTESSRYLSKGKIGVVQPAQSAPQEPVSAE